MMFGSLGLLERTITALPRKSMFSKYRPGATIIVSLLKARLIACWMDGYCPLGTLSTSATHETVSSNKKQIEDRRTLSP
jgi:hypothetical protein